MQKTIAILGSAFFFVVAPCTLAGLIPWSITRWELRPPFFGLELTRVIGVILILAVGIERNTEAPLVIRRHRAAQALDPTRRRIAVRARIACGFDQLVDEHGVPGLVDSFARFALQGLGTPAPIAPTRNLVVTGLYRYVRNPIYVAVVAIVLGQAVLLGDWRLIVYGALFWLAFHLFVVAYEEPTLEQTFGEEYEAFRANVPRWIPRMSPWRPSRMKE